MNLSETFIFFIACAFIGWCVEVVGLLIVERRFVNRGFLIGPLCPIYGIGAVIMNLSLAKYYSSPITLFVMALFICSILEYVTSYLMEKIFHARWWDYTKYKFNINGRICLETMIPFGICGLILLYVVSPLVNYLMNLVSISTLNIISVFLLLLFLLDLIVSFKVIFKFRNITMQFRSKDNTEEITKKVKEALTAKSHFTKRLVDAFPNVKMVILNIKNELTKTKNELKLTKKQLKRTNKKLIKANKKINKAK